jgi:hypothetical protein
MGGDRVEAGHRVRRLGRVGQEPAFELGIDPGACDDAGADMRADPCFDILDDLVERGRIDISLLGQDGFERAHPQLHLG